MKKQIIHHLSLFFIGFCIVTGKSGCSSGSGVGGPPKPTPNCISGQLFLENEKPAANATLFLRHSDYLPTVPSRLAKRMQAVTEIKTTFTDKNGYFLFDGIPEGRYIIEGISSDENEKIFISEIVVDSAFLSTETCIQIEPHCYQTFFSPPATIKGIAYPSRASFRNVHLYSRGESIIVNVYLSEDSIVGNVYPSGDSIVGNVFVYGLETYAEIKADGSYRLENVPEGELRLRFEAATTNNEILEKEVTVSTDAPFIDTTLLPPNLPPIILFSLPDTVINVAQGTTCTLKVVAIGTPELYYQWYKNDTLQGTTLNNTLILSSVSFSDSGTYRCKVTNEWGEASSTKMRLQVHPPVKITYYNTEGEAPVDNTTYIKGNQITVSGNTGNMKNGSMTFVGWNFVTYR